MGRLFGTDGVRGIANTELDCNLAMNIARAAATVVADDLDHPPTFLVGTDTRLSAGMLESAINAGLASVGAHSINMGVVPTPAIAYLVTNEHADAGIMISASHNPYDFNGIKIFGSEGNKLTDDQEFEIEGIIFNGEKPYPIVWGDDIGTISRGEELITHYVDHLVDSVKGTDLSGFSVALDCSNGSASQTAKALFEKLGVTATVMSSTPDGININANCGSTHMGNLMETVKNGSFDAGFAFDGDADRCLMVDEKGTLIDGDVMMAILSIDMMGEGRLKDNTLVATIMSNMGLFAFGKEYGINVKTTKVGDRYVLEEMLEHGYLLGGEQSGHVILKEYMSTGDGQLTAIHMLGAMKRSGKRASELASVMTIYPQVMKNMKADSSMKAALDIDEGAQKIIAKAAEQLGEDGRILVRPSGTEPLIRVMIEGKDTEEIQKLVDSVTENLSERLQMVASRKPLTNL